MSSQNILTGQQWKKIKIKKLYQHYLISLLFLGKMPLGRGV